MQAKSRLSVEGARAPSAKPPPFGGLASAGLAIVCAGTLTACGDDGSGTRGHADVDIALGCGPTPAKLVDYAQDVPEPGAGAVQMPAVHADTGNVFYLLNWSTGFTESGYLMRLPKWDVLPERIAVVEGGGSGRHQDLAVTPNAALFIQTGGPNPGEGAIVSVSKTGGEPKTLAATNGRANALVVDDRNAYFVDGEGTKSVPLAGGTVQTLTGLKPYSIMVEGSTLYLAEGGPPGAISSVPVEGGPVSTLAVEPLGVLHLVSCGSNLCFLTPTVMDASLKQLDREGNVTTLVTGLYKPYQLLFDGESLFVSAGWGLSRFSADGKRSASFDTDVLSNIALDDSCLYWSSITGIYAWARDAASTAEDSF